MKFKIVGITERAKNKLLEEAKSEKNNKEVELITETPPTLIIKHKLLSKWINKFSKKLKLPVETFYNNPSWINSVRNKVLKRLEKDTGLKRNEFKVEVLK